jgi:hypothetical protein
VTEFLDLPPQLLLLLPIAIAAGVDLYLTLLVVGLTSFLWEGNPVPFNLTSAIPYPALLVLGALYVAELGVELRASLALPWHNLQLIMRPLGGSLLALALLEGEAPVFLALGAGLAGIVTAYSHVLSWGQGLLLRLAPSPRLSPVTLKLLEDLGVLAFLALVFLQPGSSLAPALILLLMGLVFGHHLHGVVRFGWTVIGDMIWSFLSPPGWRSPEDLPGWIQDEVGLDPFQGLRGIRAATTGFPTGRKFQLGWLLERGGDPFFAYISGWRKQVTPMGGLTEEGRDGGTLASRIRYRSTDGASSALFLHRRGKGPESHK